MTYAFTISEIFKLLSSLPILMQNYACAVTCMFGEEGGGGIYFIIIIKMASVFKLPDVNVYVCVCVCVCGGGGGGGGLRRNNVFTLLKRLFIYIFLLLLHYTYDFILLPLLRV